MRVLFIVNWPCVVALFPRKLYVGRELRVSHPKITFFGFCLLCAPILDLTVFCVCLRLFAFVCVCLRLFAFVCVCLRSSALLCVSLRFFAFVCVLTCDRTHCNDLLMHRV